MLRRAGGRGLVKSHLAELNPGDPCECVISMSGRRASWARAVFRGWDEGFPSVLIQVPSLDPRARRMLPEAVRPLSAVDQLAALIEPLSSQRRPSATQASRP